MHGKPRNSDQCRYQRLSSFLRSTSTSTSILNMNNLVVDTVVFPNGSKSPRLRQNENGPCFVIALINAVLLQSSDSNTLSSLDDNEINKTIKHFHNDILNKSLAVPPGKVSMDHIYSFLIECLMSIDDNELPYDTLIETLPLLNDGLLINPSFNNILVNDFNIYTDTIKSILSIFNLNVYHGFLMPDHLLSNLSTNNINPTFDHCQDYLVSHIDNENNVDTLSNEINLFLNNNKTELTDIGYQSLINNQLLPNETIFLFFRNDHYNTCLKHDGQIYLLVTDIGYASQSDIVWTQLSILDDGDYYNSSFRQSIIKPLEKIKDPIKEQQETSDMLLAKQIQLQEEHHLNRSLQKQNHRKQPDLISKEIKQGKQLNQPKQITKSNIRTKSKNKSRNQSDSKNCVIV